MKKLIALKFHWGKVLVSLSLLLPNLASATGLTGFGGMDDLGKQIGQIFVVLLWTFTFFQVIYLLPKRMNGKIFSIENLIIIVIFLLCCIPWVIKPELNAFTLYIILSFIFFVAILFFFTNKSIINALMLTFFSVIFLAALLLINPTILTTNKYEYIVDNLHKSDLFVISSSESNDYLIKKYPHEFMRTSDNRVFYTQGLIHLSSNYRKDKKPNLPMHGQQVFVEKVKDCTLDCFKILIPARREIKMPGSYFNFQTGEGALITKNNNRKSLINIPIKTVKVDPFYKRHIARVSIYQNPNGTLEKQTLNSLLRMNAKLSSQNHEDALFLMQNGADPNYLGLEENNNFNRTPAPTFYYAIPKTDSEQLKSYFRFGANPTVEQKGYGESSILNGLHAAIKSKSNFEEIKKKINLMLANGVKLDQKNSKDESILDYIFKDYEVVDKELLYRYLIALGAPFSVEDKLRVNSTINAYLDKFKRRIKEIQNTEYYPNQPEWSHKARAKKQKDLDNVKHKIKTYEKLLEFTNPAPKLTKE